MKLTIKRLKKLIEKLPDDMPVVVDGYERGIECCKVASTTNLYSFAGSGGGIYGDFINERDQFFHHELLNKKTKYKGQGFYLSRFDKK